MQARVARRQLAVIQQELACLPGGDDGAVQAAVCLQGLHLHGRYGPGHKLPHLPVGGSLYGSMVQGQRILPETVVESGLLPAPGIERGVEAVAAAGGIEAPHLHLLWRIGIAAQSLPAGPGVQDLFRLAVALDHESGYSQGHDCDRPQFGEVPDYGGDGVGAGPELRSYIHRFKGPVVPVALCRTVADLHSVDIKLVAVVRRHMDDETARPLRQTQFLPEKIDPVKSIGIRALNPPAGPLGNVVAGAGGCVVHQYGVDPRVIGRKAYLPRCGQAGQQGRKQCNYGFLHSSVGSVPQK